MNKNKIEELAEYAQNSWSGWMKYLFSKCRVNKDGSVTIPKSLVDRWKTQVETDYKDLSDNMRSADIIEACKIVSIFHKD